MSSFGRILTSQLLVNRSSEPKCAAATIQKQPLRKTEQQHKQNMPVTQTLQGRTTQNSLNIKEPDTNRAVYSTNLKAVLVLSSDKQA